MAAYFLNSALFAFVSNLIIMGMLTLGVQEPSIYPKINIPELKNLKLGNFIFKLLGDCRGEMKDSNTLQIKNWINYRN